MNNYFGMIFPSQNNDVSKLESMLKCSNRFFALYSLLLFWLIRWSLSGNISTGNETFLYLFFGQAAILLYVFQTYRRYFAVSKLIRKKRYLYALVGLWLIFFLVFNFLQIVLSSVYAAEIAFSFSWIITNAIPLILAATGEYLFRKAVEN